MLKYKMIHNGIDGKLYFLLKSIYASTEACVNINGQNTSWFKTRSGVMQGDCLSPTLFNLFINDLAVHLKDMNVGITIEETLIPILLYADDVVILANDESEMQKMLNIVNKWCDQWKMKVNMSKTKVMHFREKKGNQCVKEIYLGRQVVENTDCYKYLGV